MYKKEHEKIIRVKEACEQEFLHLPDIHAVGIGYKVRGGKQTDQLSIVVHTIQKRKDILEHQRIPTWIEGIPTDVIEIPPFQQLPLELNEVNVASSDNMKYRPVPGGAEIYMPRSSTNGGICTLGMYAQSIKEGDSASDIYLLTNAHCLMNVDQAVLQPISDKPEDLIGFSSRILDNERIDGGIAKLTSFEIADPFQILEIGDIGGLYNLTIDDIGRGVMKHGRTTGTTIGIIDYVFVTIVDKRDQIVIRGEVPFAQPGDSGSVVLFDENPNKNYVVGLLWGGVLNYAIMSPIYAVSEELEIALITDQIPIFQF